MASAVEWPFKKRRAGKNDQVKRKLFFSIRADEWFGVRHQLLQEGAPLIDRVSFMSPPRCLCATGWGATKCSPANVTATVKTNGDDELRGLSSVTPRCRTGRAHL